MFVFKLKRKFTFEQIYVVTIDNLHWQYFHEQKVKNLGLFLNFGSQNRKPKAENFPFRPKVSASGIPLVFRKLPENLYPFSINLSGS